MAQRIPAQPDEERGRDEVIRLQERIRELRTQLDKLDASVPEGDRNG